MSYQKLFSPVKMGSLEVPNRIMRTSMVSGLATEDGQVTDDLVERYKREAAGGVGALVVEAAVVLPSRSSYNLRISDDSCTDPLKRITAGCKEANPETRVGLQIMQFLKLARSGWRQKVTDYKPEDLEMCVKYHVDGARRAVEAGFQFIELHMAHAYTLSSFLSLSNERTDEYGGSLQNRMRLPIQVYEAVRKEVGPDYPLGIRINGEDFTLKGTTTLQSTRIAKKFAELGVAFISVSAGSRFEDAPTPPPDTPYDPMSGYSGSRMSPDWHFPDGTHVHLSESIKGYVNQAGLDTPVIIAGKIRTPAHAERILEQGRTDMVGLCRALLCDPDWPLKAREDRAKEIVGCTACNWCLEADSRYEKVNCSRWPEGLLAAPTPWLKKDARASALGKNTEA